MNTDKFFICDFFGILWTGGIRPIWVQKNGRKKLMRFTQFFCLLLKNCIKAIKRVSFINYLCTIFGPKMS